jgi:hypothetical protein
MLTISVKLDLKKLNKGLDEITRKQVPFATAAALTDTARQGRKVVQRVMPRYLDRPTPFTVRGVLFERATKTRLASSVFIREEVWKYLKYQVDGGVRSGKGFIAVPARARKLNAYGNIPGKRTGLVKGGAYIAKRGDTLGVWKKPDRKGRSPLLVLFTSQAVYRPRFPFRRIVRRVVAKHFVKLWNKRMVQALRTAR